MIKFFYIMFLNPDPHSAKGLDPDLSNANPLHCTAESVRPIALATVFTEQESNLSRSYILSC